MDTAHNLLAGGRHSAVGTAQEPQGGPPARPQKLLFLGLKLTSSYSNQVCTEYQKGTENSIRLTRPRLEEHTVHPGSETHTHIEIVHQQAFIKHVPTFILHSAGWGGDGDSPGAEGGAYAVLATQMAVVTDSCWDVGLNARPGSVAMGSGQPAASCRKSLGLSLLISKMRDLNQAILPGLTCPSVDTINAIGCQ